MSSDAASHVAGVATLTARFEELGVDDEVAANAAVDLMDLLHALDVVRVDLRRLTSNEREGSPLELLGRMEVQLFTEIKSHLRSLEDQWEKLAEAFEE